jgi:hypothetical protein
MQTGRGVYRRAAFPCSFGRPSGTRAGLDQHRAALCSGSNLTELLEQRVMLSVTPRALPASTIKPIATESQAVGSTIPPGWNAPAKLTPITGTATPGVTQPGVTPAGVTPAGVTPAAFPGYYTPAQLRSYYGLNSFTFNGTTANGSGQTIAIIDFGDDPTVASDLAEFDSYLGIQAPPSLTVLNENGGTSLPATGSEDDQLEESLDVQWAHAMAPNAAIDVLEIPDPQVVSDFSNITTAVNTAKTLSGVSVVSMSIGWPEQNFLYGGVETQGYQFPDSAFTTPSGHIGVTFVASSGDGGSYPGNPGYIASGNSVNSMASSPNVLSVGGTTLNYNSGGTPTGEIAWGYNSSTSGYYEGSGGGVSAIESEPAYQVAVAGTQSGRSVPDVAFDADPNTGVLIVYNGGGYAIGGTSLSAPCWAGLIAVANQGRVLKSLPTLNGTSEPTLNAIYDLPTGDFNDITSGTNGGYTAKTGYDLTTGRGTPITNKLIPDLVKALPTLTSTASETGNTQNSAVLKDSVVVANGSSPTGTITYTLTAPDGTTSTIGTSTVSGNGTYNSPTTTAKEAGTYTWHASYGGDSNNLTATDQGGSTEQLAVLPSWVGSGSVATWNVSTSTLAVTGAASIVADPGSAEPLVQASGSAAVLALNPTSGIDIHLGGLSVSGGAKATVTSLGSARSLTNYHLLIIGTPGATAAPTFSIDSTSTLDLADNDMAILYGTGTSPLQVVQGEIQSAYDAGKWDKAGLTSSVAPTTNGATGLGYATSTELGTTTFDGLILGGKAVLVKYTLMGDSTLSGTVSGTDYNTVLANYDTNGDWSQGNFHYGGTYSAGTFTNGQIAGQDYNFVLGHFDNSLVSYLVAAADVPAITPTTIASTSTTTHISAGKKVQPKYHIAGSLQRSRPPQSI